MKAVRLGSMDDVIKVLRPLLRWRYVILTVTAYAFAFQHMRGTGTDWHYFMEGSQLIFGNHPPAHSLPGGLHFYANYPEFQIGPLALVVAAPLRIIGGDHSRELAVILMTALAPLLVIVLERTARHLAPTDERGEFMRNVTVLFGGILVVQAWANVTALYTHLDDVVALTLLVGTVCAVAYRRPVWAGVALGAAVAAKPWAVVALPVIVALPGRDRWRSMVALVATSFLAWGPFVLAAPNTLHAMQPQVQVARGSVLHLFGVPRKDAQAWMRWLQLLTSVTLGLIAVRRGRWVAALLIGIAVRVALDPQIFLYYGTGLVLAAFVWDLLRTERPLPLMTLFAFVFLDDAYTTVTDPMIQAAMRLVVTVGAIAVVLGVPQHAAVPPSSALEPSAR